MSATQDYVALEWIRGELANTLQNAQQALEAVAETPDDAASMRSCLSSIHQVYGTLKMVQLEGPTALAGEMESVAQSLMNNAVPDLRAAQEMLMQSILQLPAYLDKLHREQADTEQNYLPIVNNLRVSRGEQRLPGSEPVADDAAGGPDISPLQIPPADSVVNTFFQADGEGNLPKVRLRYNQALSAILKKTDVRENLKTLGKLFTMLIRLCGESPMGNLSQLGLGLIEGIANGGIKLDNHSATQLKKIDGAIKRLADTGQGGLAEPIDSDLAYALIALIQSARKETTRIVSLRERYKNAASKPEEMSVGLDDETMSAVASILIEELKAVTDKLDLYVRSQTRHNNDLVELLPNLAQISSTMVVLGNTEQQQTVAAQIDAIRVIEAGETPSDEVLLSMAESLLEIESSLGMLVIGGEEGADSNSFASLDEAQAAVVRETRVGLASSKDAVINFIASDFDHDKLEGLPESLRALRGGLMIVNQTRAGDVLVSAADYLERSLLANRTIPALEQMDDLADAVTSVDYFLERLLENASDPYLQMLEVAEAAIEKLDIPAADEVPVAHEEPVADEVPVAHEVPVADEESLAEEELFEDSADVEALSEPSPPDSGDKLIDDEILEIFVDEAEEVLQTIAEFLPQWRADTNNSDALTEIRRAFHTLKGSGRMVGATVVGELAWSIENLLNRVIDNTIVPDSVLMELIEMTVAKVPEGISAFSAGRQHDFKPEALVDAAQAIAAGETPQLPEPAIVDPAAQDPAAITDETTGEEAVEEDLTLSLLADEDNIEIAEADELAVEDSAMVEGAANPPVRDEQTLTISDAESVELDTIDEESFDEDVLDEQPHLEEITAEETPDEEFTVEDVSVDELALDELDVEQTLEVEPAIDESGSEELLEDLIREEVKEEVEDDLEADSDIPGFEVADIDETAFELEDIVEDETQFTLDVVEDAIDETLPTSIDAESLLEDDDLELEDIFKIEAEEKLAQLDAFLAAPGSVNSEIVAAFHTLKGSAAMAEIPSISQIAAPLESLSNDYLLQSKPADDRLLEATTEAVRLIRNVLADIPAHREQVAGADALLAMLTVIDAESPDVVTFDFQDIILLSQANIASDGWHDIEALVAELRIALDQAESLDQPAVSALLKSVLRVYSEAPGKPDDLTLSLMKRAHDHLVFMFDAIASSQTIRPADGVVADLDAIDLSAIVVEQPDSEALPSLTDGEIVEFDSVADDLGDVEESLEDAEAPLQQAEAPLQQAEALSQQAEALLEEAEALPRDEIDEDILPIFLEETEELLEALDESVLGWSQSGTADEHLDNLLRQLHTLKGGARMAGASSLGEYAHNVETFLIGLGSNPVEFDDEFFSLLNAQQDEIRRRVEVYEKLAAGAVTQEELDSLKTAVKPDLAAIAPVASPVIAPERAPPALVVAAGGDTVVDLPADAIDQDILPIFLEESDDLVEELETSIQSWSESPGDMGTLDVLLRNLHTLKGGARMAGLNSLGEYAHNFETFLIGIQQNPVELDDEFFALLNKRQDEVIRRVEIYKRFSVGAASDEDLDSLKKALEPTLETDASEVTEASEETEVVVDAQPAAAPSEKQTASANQEMVRVSADLLEELVSLAGESSINRGRVEQQITDFGESLQEMEETIHRIRDQVRRLEIEAESRETLIRSRKASVGETPFDELEMDRYTMLQAISRALSEGTSDMMDLKDTLGNRSRDAETLLHQQARISGELQEGLTRTRMVPFARLIPRLRRIVRQISTEVGKSVRFDAYNVEGELDRNVLERIVAPLEHMLRNAVDHGIEDKDKRLAAGKQEQGRISLRLSREGGYVVLTISDDGGGIDVNAVRAKAVERGLITQDQQVSDHEVMQFIMHAGFSTAQKLTQISGRGVGMDVVGSEIKSLGGSITIDSSLNVGSEFTIRIPFTVSINRALMVVVKEEIYAVPLNTIEGIVRVSPYELEAYYQPDAPMFEYAGQPYKLAYIGKMLDKAEDPNLTGQVAPLPVILARSGDHAVALQVDRVIGSREVVVKTLGPQFGDVGGISGATVLGDGSVVIILDCMALVRSYEIGAEKRPEAPVSPEAAEPDRNVRTIMIVDDSVTVRKVTSRLMERQGFEVATAKDGIDAMNQLQDIRPDVVLLDIEMPRMDGFEVLRSVRRDENLKDLPIIMITSRTGEKHKQQAMELGVNQYLGKPFQEANLLATIEEVIESARNKSGQD